MFMKIKNHKLFLIYHSFAIEIINLTDLLDNRKNFRIFKFNFKFSELSFDIPKNGQYIFFGDCKEQNGPKVFRQNFTRQKLYVLNCLEYESDQVKSVCLDRNSSKMISLLEQNKPIVLNTHTGKRITTLETNLRNELKSLFWEDKYLFLKSKKHLKIFDFKSMRILKKFSISFDFIKVIGINKSIESKDKLSIIFTKSNSRTLLKKKITFNTFNNSSIVLTASRISFPEGNVHLNK